MTADTAFFSSSGSSEIALSTFVGGSSLNVSRAGSYANDERRLAGGGGFLGASDMMTTVFEQSLMY
jgi:hypothetical protein